MDSLIVPIGNHPKYGDENESRKSEKRNNKFFKHTKLLKESIIDRPCSVIDSFWIDRETISINLFDTRYKYIKSSPCFFSIIIEKYLRILQKRAS